MTNQDYTDVLLEDMNTKFDVLLEAIQPLGKMSEDLHQTMQDVAELKTDVKVIKAAVTDLSTQVNDREQRVTVLETL